MEANARLEVSMRQSAALGVVSVLMLGLAAAASAQQASAPPASVDVQLAAPDGVKLKATYYAAAKPGPGILLFHMCNSNRQAWSALASKMAARGYHVLAMDYRGYGESEGTRSTNGAEQQVIVAEKWPGDVDAAFTWLTSQKDVDRQRIAAGGGSCGVNQSLLASRRHPEIKTVVLLSGAGSPAAREHVAKTPSLPIFGAASHGDGGAVEAMRWLLQWSGNRDNKFLEYQAAGHGTDMFAVEKGLEPAILDWLDARLRTAPAAPLTSAATAAPSRVKEFWDVLARPDGESTARRIFEETRKQDPKFVLFPEGELNLYGYQILQNDPNHAIWLFKLNVDAYPKSANPHDSLSDAYLAAGKRKEALHHAEKALEMLPGDTTIGDEFRATLKESAEQKIRELKKTSS
jgi:dienelactone hydrolase